VTLFSKAPRFTLALMHQTCIDKVLFSLPHAIMPSWFVTAPCASLFRRKAKIISNASVTLLCAKRTARVILMNQNTVPDIAVGRKINQLLLPPHAHLYGGSWLSRFSSF
jgi:hypothetical protein